MHIDNVNNAIHRGLFLKIWTYTFSSTSSSTSLDGLWCEVYDYCLYTSSYLCCTDPWLMLMQDLVYCMLSWFLAWFNVEYFIWCTCCHKSSFYALRSLVVCFWDTLVVVMHVLFWNPFYAMLAGWSPCMFLCHIDRSLIENSGCGISLRATPAWGNYSLYDRDIISVYITIIDNT